MAVDGCRESDTTKARAGTRAVEGRFGGGSPYPDPPARVRRARSMHYIFGDGAPLETAHRWRPVDSPHSPPAPTAMPTRRPSRLPSLPVAVPVLASLLAVFGGCAEPDSERSILSEPAAEEAAAPPPASPAASRAAADTSAGESAAAGTATVRVDPSFDCDATDLGEVETRICADSALARLDVRLDSVWSTALERARGTAMPQLWVDEMVAYQRGWVSGRDECWKAPEEAAYRELSEDEAIRLCTETAYRERIARLQADWGLVRVTTGPVFWVCGDDPANEFVTTYFATDPEAVRVERGDQSEVFLRTPTASGARYEGFSGKSFWDRGGSAAFVWPEGETRICVAQG